MTLDIVSYIILVVGLTIIPAITIYSHWKVGWDSRNKKRKIAEFLEKAAEQQIQDKDGPK